MFSHPVTFVFHVFFCPRIPWHILGNRLIPVIRSFEFNGILHVGPTKSLTFSRGVAKIPYEKKRNLEKVGKLKHRWEKTCDDI